jgi:hypothetical protein
MYKGLSLVQPTDTALEPIASPLLEAKSGNLPSISTEGQASTSGQDSALTDFERSGGLVHLRFRNDFF